MLKLYTTFLFEKAFQSFEAGQRQECKDACEGLDDLTNLSQAQEDFNCFFAADTFGTFLERTEGALDLARECIEKFDTRVKPGIW